MSLENSSLSVHVTGTGVILALLAALTAVHLAVLADKVLVLLDVMGLEADAEQVGAVVHYPRHLEGCTAIRYAACKKV